ncbi:MAG: hypothetical protein HS116_05255 [Planctomycetes bacterium]|nr:hypothetical protein [Planctomycetota bacterium]
MAAPSEKEQEEAIKSLQGEWDLWCQLCRENDATKNAQVLAELVRFWRNEGSIEARRVGYPAAWKLGLQQDLVVAREYLRLAGVPKFEIESPNQVWRRLALVVEAASNQILRAAAVDSAGEQLRSLNGSIEFDGLVCILNGARYPLTEDQAKILRSLIEARGEVRSGPDLAPGQRVDRIVKAFPSAIRRLVGVVKGRGYAWNGPL